MWNFDEDSNYVVNRSNVVVISIFSMENRYSERGFPCMNSYKMVRSAEKALSDNNGIRNQTPIISTVAYNISYDRRTDIRLT